MRWDSLLTDERAQPPALFERGAVARTFDTPEFRGMTFYEISARSIINRVADASRVPFRWTINPYRGCNHACTYCLAGHTPILMADGRTRPVSHVHAGDRVYGTVRDGRSRRCVITEVLAHWSTVKAAYAVTLRDGARLIASGDHRFLSDRGWAHVTGTADGGPPRRPHLGLDSELVGVGNFAGPREVSADNRRGRIAGTAIRSDPQLRVVSIEPLGVDLEMFDITTGTGDFIADGVVSHNCFARSTHTYLDFDAGHDFDSRIVVKVNAPELTRRELASPRWSGEHIAMGTNVDCYQRAEGRYRLMPAIIGALADAANPFSILTKGTLILRDADLLAAAAEVTDVGLNVSVGFIDAGLSRSVEPGTPAPRRRLEVCAALVARGLRCGVLMGPVLPFLSDSRAQLEATVRAIAESGATSVSSIVLHLRPGARQWYLRWLAEWHPALVPRYRALYRGGAYAPRAYQDRIAAQVRDLADRLGVGRASPVRRAESRGWAAAPRHAAADADQLRLL